MYYIYIYISKINNNDAVSSMYQVWYTCISIYLNLCLYLYLSDGLYMMWKYSYSAEASTIHPDALPLSSSQIIPSMYPASLPFECLHQETNIQITKLLSADEFKDFFLERSGSWYTTNVEPPILIFHQVIFPNRLVKDTASLAHQLEAARCQPSAQSNRLIQSWVLWKLPQSLFPVVAERERLTATGHGDQHRWSPLESWKSTRNPQVKRGHQQVMTSLIPQELHHGSTVARAGDGNPLLLPCQRHAALGERSH